MFQCGRGRSFRSNAKQCFVLHAIYVTSDRNTTPLVDNTHERNFQSLGIFIRDQNLQFLNHVPIIFLKKNFSYRISNLKIFLTRILDVSSLIDIHKNFYRNNKDFLQGFLYPFANLSNEQKVRKVTRPRSERTPCRTSETIQIRGNIRRGEPRRETNLIPLEN